MTRMVHSIHFGFLLKDPAPLKIEAALDHPLFLYNFRRPVNAKLKLLIYASYETNKIAQLFKWF